MDEEVRIEVGRDVAGQIAVGHHLIQLSGAHSSVTLIQREQLPRPVPREDMTLLPRPAEDIIGREEEAADVVRAVAGGGPVQLYGAAGIGKSTLLRRVAHRLAADGGRVVYLHATGRESGDVLQDLFEACYEAPGYRPGRAELRKLMTGLELRLLLDGLSCPAEELGELLDAAPAATYLVACTDRTLWGEGTAKRLRGLGPADSVELLERALDRDLDTAELRTARTLWQLTEGTPLRLLNAAAAADRAGGPLPRPGELAELLPLVVERLTEPELAVARVLALAGSGGAGPALLSTLVREGPEAPGGSAAGVTQASTAVPAGGVPAGDGIGAVRDVCDGLVAAGLALETEHGYRSAPGVTLGADEASGPSTEALVALAERLRRWVIAPERGPAELADHAELVAGVVDAVTRAGQPRVGAQLAKAAAPGTARSLRMGAWGRILERGKTAAEGAGDRRLLAYFTHEDGIRRLVTGKRTAAVALALAVALWRELGDDGGAKAAEHGRTLCDSGSLPTDIPHHAPSPEHAAAHGTKAAATKVGLGAKLVIGGGLAAVVAGGTVLGLHHGSDTVPLRVHVVTSAVQVTMPGKAEQGCRRGASGTDCTTVVKAAKGEKGPVSVDPEGELPQGTKILYWGCQEGAAASSCTVVADRAKTVCVSTSSAKDEAARAACGGEAPAGAKAKTYPLEVALFTDWRITVTGTPGKCFHDTGVAASCGPYKLAKGDSVKLSATIDGPDPFADLAIGGPRQYDNTPVWYGCDEGPRSSTCTYKMTDERITAFEKWQKGTDAQNPQHVPIAVCVTTANDPSEATTAAQCEILTSGKG
ncbi:hypothetical protein [Streptomyces sp. NBC_00203]|uniref:hypothetical protein n=1 Tax=Streptomyces sp. NBC_00203 TaxID=2975680 RepID=UPI003250DF28